MSAFQLVLSAEAINDLDQAVEYYNRLSDGLGFEFADTIDRYFTSKAGGGDELKTIYLSHLLFSLPIDLDDIPAIVSPMDNNQPPQILFTFSCLEI